MIFFHTYINILDPKFIMTPSVLDLAHPILGKFLAEASLLSRKARTTGTRSHL